MRYVAYGSNLHPRRLRERIPSARLLTTSLLPGWSLRFHKRSNDGSGKCNIVAGGDGVHVAIFEISATDKLTLDSIEGLGVGYAGIVLDFPEMGGCHSYVAQPSHIDESLDPYDWYKELVLLGARVHGFPEAYVDGIRSLPVRPDPDANRRLERWKTVEMVKSAT